MIFCSLTFTQPSCLSLTSLWQDACSVVSDYDCPCVEVCSSVEDLQGLSPSLRDSEYFKDLEGGALMSTVTTILENQIQQNLGSPVSLNTNRCALELSERSPLSTLPPQVTLPSFPFYNQPAEEPARSFVVTQVDPKLLPGCIIDSGDAVGPAAGLSLTINLNGLLGSMDTAKPITRQEGAMEQDSVETELDSFPILVRSMSTSRRHSWGIPVSPINLGRR